MRMARGFLAVTLSVLFAGLAATAEAQNDYKPFPVKVETGKAVTVDLVKTLGPGEYIRLSGPKGLEVSKTGVLTWTPIYGEHSLVILNTKPHQVHRFKIQVDDPAGGVGVKPPRPEPATTRPPRRPPPPPAEPNRRSAAAIGPDAKPVAEDVAGPQRQSYTCPGIAAGLLMPDLKTVVLSIPTRAELVLFDTEAFQEVKKLSVEFKPGALAVQGGNLFVAAKGAALVYVLDAKTGKQKAEIEVPGSGVVQLACHPLQGLLYASTEDLKVFAIDPAAGKAVFTGGRGHFLAVAPDGRFVYTGTQPISEEEVKVIHDADGSFHMIWDDWGARAFMARYAVHGTKLDLAGINPNAAVNAHNFALSADGEVVAMAGGGGWRPKAPTRGGGYEVDFFRTKDMTSTAGKVEVGAYPEGLAFHPVLKLGVTCQSKGGNRMIVFQAKSFVTRQEISTANGPMPSAFLGFGDLGRKIVFASDRGLHALPLELTAEELAQLKNPPPQPLPSAETPTTPVETEFPIRTWTDASGDYHIDARYVGVSDGKVILIRRSGGRITMALDRLSPEDQKYVRDLQGK